MISTVIFDFDGVLVESVDIKTQAFARLFGNEGNEVLKLVLDYHLQHSGISRFEKFKYIYNNILKRELTEKFFEGLCQKFSELVVDEVVNAPYVDGAKGFLDRYATKYKFFIASATPQGELKEIVKRRGMNGYFVEIYGAPKIKAEIVREIIWKHNLKPDEVVYIGDALSDYEAARANAVNFIARTDSNKTIFANIDCIKVKNLNDLKSLLDRGLK